MQQICSQFRLEGTVLACERHGGGHINQTYLITTDRAQYILQRLSPAVFPDIPALMCNIGAVTNYLRTRTDDPRRTLTLIPTVAGEDLLTTEDGEYWRMYNYITDSICLLQAETPEDLYQSGVAFGTFQEQLADFPADTLTETIARFHDTPNRFRLFHEAIEADRVGRLASVRGEVARFLSREGEASSMVDMCAAGELPLRVTHNDTKLSNVLLDAKDRTPLCVIDLDTVMPGLAGNDFGDAIRFGASTALEDEKDLTKVEMSLELYRAFAGGFLSACGHSLTDREIETLPLGAKLMTLECGVRFLTDYLNGDTYFHVSYPEQNLDRCRTQITLVEDMERKWADMQRITQECAGR